jgi:hypothetical protein
MHGSLSTLTTNNRDHPAVQQLLLDQDGGAAAGAARRPGWGEGDVGHPAVAAQAPLNGGAGVEGEVWFLHKNNLEASLPPGGSSGVNCGRGG